VPEEAVPGCDLCAAERRTHWHHEDEVCWVADCQICSVPMVVWKRHGAVPPDDERAHMLARLGEVGVARFGDGGFTVDAVMRRIPDHFHAHARPRGGFFGHGFRKDTAGGGAS
jgi:hypothetical protein